MKLAFIYDYFLPGFRAGGPVQSLVNLSRLLSQNQEVIIITGNKDHGSTEIYPEVVSDSWTSVTLTSNNPIPVYYAGKTSLRFYLRQLSEQQPGAIYVNGIFSYRFFILPVIASRWLNIPTVICPRGMLQSGALSLKRTKKGIYLFLLRKTGLLNRTYWHATNEEEKKDILKIFPRNKGISIAANIPQKPLLYAPFSAKKTDELRLVYLSLIAEKKNLHLLLESMLMTDNITLDVYGPVKDEVYWKNKCLPIIEQLGSRVTYHGDIHPSLVQQTIAGFDMFVLLSAGENFGHAIYESLSAGRPVLLSNNTPWVNLQEKKAGANINITHPRDIKNYLEYFRSMDSEEHNELCANAHKIACEYYNGQDFERDYSNLFSI